MSFRKRGDLLNGRESGSRTVPGRVPSSGIANGRSVGRQPEVSKIVRTREQNPRMGAAIDSSRLSAGFAPGFHNRNVQNKEINNNLESNHPGLRPSPASSQATTSTGCSHLDKVLGHMGLPLGNSIIVEEQGTTDFSSILCKLFAAQGIMHNRVENVASHSANTHLCVISSNQGFAKELPGVYKGSSKEIKKSKIAEEQSKVTVQNLSKDTAPSRFKDLKIAWRYRLNGEEDGERAAANESASLDKEYKDYNHQFDITSNIVPAPTSSEISFISPAQPTQRILSQLEQSILKNSNKLIRIIVPSLLHPAMYGPDFFRLAGIVPLVHGLRSLVKKYEGKCVLFATISSDIIDELLLGQIETTFDSVVSLEPFNQEMLQFLEKAYKSQPNKVQHGLLHVAKLPVFSDRGEMHVMRSHYAFKNSRKKFEIEEWGIPVSDVEESKDTTTSSDPRSDQVNNMKSSSEAIQGTKISVDF